MGQTWERLPDSHGRSSTARPRAGRPPSAHHGAGEVPDTNTPTEAACAPSHARGNRPPWRRSGCLQESQVERRWSGRPNESSRAPANRQGQSFECKRACADQWPPQALGPMTAGCLAHQFGDRSAAAPARAKPERSAAWQIKRLPPSAWSTRHVWTPPSPRPSTEDLGLGRSPSIAAPRHRAGRRESE